MKLRYFFAVSLIANLIFVIQWIRPLNQVEKNPGMDGSGHQSEEMPEEFQTALDLNTEPSDNDIVEEVVASDAALIWESIESEDYLTYMDNLRRIGCPEETIVDIIKADVGKMFRQRRKEMIASLPEIEYWKKSPWDEYFSAKASEIEAIRKLGEEHESILKTLLGNQYISGDESIVKSQAQTMEMIMQQKPLDFLSKDKSRLVNGIFDEIQESMIEVSAQNQKDYTKLAGLMSNLQVERDRRLDELLTPEEKFEVDLRKSDSAYALKLTIETMDPTEQEFRDIFALKQKINKESMVEYNQGIDWSQKAEQQLNKELQDRLGEERYRDFSLSRDSQFRELHRISQSAGIDRNTALEAYEIQKSAQEALGQLQSQPGIAADAMTEAVNQIRAESASALQDKLGSKGWEQYKYSSAARWLNSAP